MLKPKQTRLSKGLAVAVALLSIVSVLTTYRLLTEPRIVTVDGTKFQLVHVGDLLDEYVAGKIPRNLRLPNDAEWQKWVVQQGNSISPFQELRRGKPGILAGDAGGNLLSVVR